MLRKNTVKPTKQIAQIVAANGHEISDGNGYTNSSSLFFSTACAKNYCTGKKVFSTTKLVVKDRTDREMGSVKITY